MKHNRSLKDLNFYSRRSKQQKPYTPTLQFRMPSPVKNYTLNFDNMIRQLQVQNNKERQISRQLKSCRSQKNFASANNSPHYNPNFISIKPSKIERERTDRSKRKESNTKQVQEEYQTTINKINRLFHDLETNILAPINKNIPSSTSYLEPRKPKILLKKQIPFTEQFKFIKVLGRGRFGNVYSARHVPSNFIVAVKRISLEKVSKALIQRLSWQIKIQSFLKHEYILDMYKYVKEGNNLYLLVEHGDYSLFDKLRQKKFFSEIETCYYISQTIKALRYMHERGVIHRDIKPENIVLINNVVKLADFGWSVYLDNNSKRKTFCGTLDYVSPEIVMGDEYDQMVDVWSVGVLCYEICTGHAPFESKRSREQTYKKILKVDLKFPRYLSTDIKDFIQRLLTKDPSKRMTLDQAISHPWMRRYSQN